jgi:hypothetical protein
MIVTLAEMLPVAFVQRAGLAIRCADISNLLLGIVDIARRNATSTSRSGDIPPESKKGDFVSDTAGNRRTADRSIVASFNHDCDAVVELDFIGTFDFDVLIQRREAVSSPAK